MALGNTDCGLSEMATPQLAVLARCRCRGSLSGCRRSLEGIIKWRRSTLLAPA